MKPEAEMCSRFEMHLARLTEAGRCIWRPQVRLQLPPMPGQTGGTVNFGRIDYVLQLDGGAPVGVEAKRAPERTAQFGDMLRQAHDYTRGVVAPQVLPQPAQPWQHQPLYAVFLACEVPQEDATRREAGYYARRIMSPFRVGFVTHRLWHGLHLSLGSEDRWWSEARGYREGAFARRDRLGHGVRSVPV